MSATSDVKQVGTRSRHIHEIDVVRVLTFAAVIAVHTVAHTTPSDSVAANGVLMLLHFTREAFFFLTGFVLVHQYIHRHVELRQFYWRRVVTVGVPYLLWTAIYTYLPQHWRLHGAPISTLIRNIGFGTATYHLYFLLVSLQIYLLYPLIAKLIRATVGHHRALLAISVVLQAALFAYLQYRPATTGWLGNVIHHQDALIVCYQFYVLLGAVLAFHAPVVRDWIATHRGVITAALVPALALALGWYLVAEANGRAPVSAAAVLQPVMLPWSVAMIFGLFALGSLWSQRRVPGSRVDRVLNYGSDRSFGIFLVHPAVLGYVLDLGWIKRMPALGQSVLAYLFTVAGSLLVVELFRRSPLSQPLTGRSMIRPHSHKQVTPEAQHQPKEGEQALDSPKTVTADPAARVDQKGN